MTSLTYEAILHLHTIDNRRAVTDDRVLTDHARTDIYGVTRTVQDRAVADAGGTVDLAVVVDDRIRDLLGTDDLHIVTDDSTFRHVPFNILIDQSAYLCQDVLVGEVLHHEGSKLTVQVSEQDGITVTSLVQHRDQVSFPVGCSLCSFDDAHIRDKAVITDSIVIDISCHVLDKTVVTDGYVT